MSGPAWMVIACAFAAAGLGLLTVGTLIEPAWPGPSAGPLCAPAHREYPLGSGEVQLSLPMGCSPPYISASPRPDGRVVTMIVFDYPEEGGR